MVQAQSLLPLGFVYPVYPHRMASQSVMGMVSRGTGEICESCFFLAICSRAFFCFWILCSRSSPHTRPRAR